MTTTRRQTKAKMARRIVKDDVRDRELSLYLEFSMSHKNYSWFTGARPVRFELCMESG